jgi:TRAP-type C4-dicarboxylate transport system permease small subunit
MITPHQSQFTVFGGAYGSERNEAIGHEAPKNKIASPWRWTTALMAVAAVVAFLTVLHYQLGHYSSLRNEPATDGFLIVDPFRM